MRRRVPYSDLVVNCYAHFFSSYFRYEYQVGSDSRAAIYFSDQKEHVKNLTRTLGGGCWNTGSACVDTGCSTSNGYCSGASCVCIYYA